MDGFNLIRHTTNYQAMVAFYRDGLGLVPVETWDEPGNRGAILRFDQPLDKVTVEVLDMTGLTELGVAPGNLAVSLAVLSVAEWSERLRAAGVPIVRGIEDTPWGIRSFGIDDPDGLRIWFQQDIGR